MQKNVNEPVAKERFVWEKPDKEKLRFLKRKQEELESKRALADFKRHFREETND